MLKIMELFLIILMKRNVINWPKCFLSVTETVKNVFGRAIQKKQTFETLFHKTSMVFSIIERIQKKFPKHYQMLISHQREKDCLMNLFFRY